ncbi:cytochrome c oxidase subunit 3 [Methylocystis rosea]|uniref:Cytochrome c oxidase subunit III n=1 Tax=Methylocystis rosea TaxID=173366 RepID=A0A3G8M7F4_9HYPH|nr:cytochrome c oxidase subunit 3 [Methylocystis rosea]AZG77687.1 cytochrome c oxidase subunit III [Methylocystis rosea]
MSVMGLFFVFIATVAVMWLVRQGVLESPWLEEGEVAHYRRAGRAAEPPTAGRVGLAVFLAVAGCLFSLLAAAFFMRGDAPDWQMPPIPGVLWVNTFLLAASSAALQVAVVAARRADAERVKTALLVGAVTAALFLIGQIWAWRELLELRFFASSNAANAFFYLLTGVHALHLIGGLVALARTTDKVRGAERVTKALTTRVELCAIYWHFLLFVWLLMFAMLIGWADGFGAICRRLLS